MVTFGATFVKTWATFSLNIWSHLRPASMSLIMAVNQVGWQLRSNDFLSKINQIGTYSTIWIKQL